MEDFPLSEKRNKKRMSGYDRKRLLVKSAIEVFSEENYRVARVSDITSLANVSEPMLYRHFSSKKELYFYVLETIIDKAIEKIKNASKNASNPLEAIELSLHDGRRTLPKYEKELKLQFGSFAEFSDPEMKNQILKFHLAAVEFYESLIKEGIQTGHIREDVNPNTAAWKILGHTIHMNIFYLTGVLTKEYSEELIASIINELKNKE